MSIDLRKYRRGQTISTWELAGLVGCKPDHRDFPVRVLRMVKLPLEHKHGILSRAKRGELYLLETHEHAAYAESQAALACDRIVRNARRLELTSTDGMEQATRRDLESASRRLAVMSASVLAHQKRREIETGIFGSSSQEPDEEEELADLGLLTELEAAQ